MKCISSRRPLLAALGASLALHALLLAAPAPDAGQGAPVGELRAALVASGHDVPPRSAAAPAERPAGVARNEGRPAAGSFYYSLHELDVRPWIRTRVEPEYPEAAARRFLSGSVVVQLYIDEAGAVERVAVVRAAPRGHFEAAAERAFRAARFTPGMKGGRAVKVQMLIEVTFEHPAPPALPDAGSQT